MKRRDFLKMFGLVPIAPVILAAEEPKPEPAKNLVCPTELILKKGFMVIQNELLLLDNWQGYPTDGPNPADWGEIHSEEWFPLGIKRQVYDDTNKGFAMLVYLHYNNPPSGARLRAKTKRLCCLDIRGSKRKKGKWYCATNVITKEQLLLPLAVHLGPMINSTYAWFWCGGVFPVDALPGLKREEEKLIMLLANLEEGT